MRTLRLLGTIVFFSCALTGCVAAEPQTSAPSAQQGESDALADSGDDLELPFLSIDADFLDTDHEYSVLFEVVDAGGREYPLLALTGSSDQLLLAIGCDRDSPFELALISNGTVVDKTWADNCASERGTPSSTYLSAPLEVDLSTLQLGVTVEDDVQFSVSVFEVGSASD